jgi:hypothetical protein
MLLPFQFLLTTTLTREDIAEDSHLNPCTLEFWAPFSKSWEEDMILARTAFIILILPFLISPFSGCTETPPTPFSLGQEIPMGSHKLKVSKYETGIIRQYIPKQMVPTESSEKILRLLGEVRPDAPAFVIFFSYSKDGEEGNLFSLTTLNNQMFYVMNRNEEKIYSLAVLPKRLLFIGEGWIVDSNDVDEAMHDLQKPKDFFAIFALEKGPGGVTVFIKNPSKREGQAGIASLSLGS